MKPQNRSRKKTMSTNTPIDFFKKCLSDNRLTQTMALAKPFGFNNVFDSDIFIRANSTRFIDFWTINDRKHYILKRGSSFMKSVITPRILHCCEKSNVQTSENTGSINRAVPQDKPCTFDDTVAMFVQNELPMDRVRRTYLGAAIENGNYAHYNWMLKYMMIPVYGSFLVGFIMGSSHAQRDFKKVFAASVFANQSMAQRKRVNYILMKAFQGGFRYTRKVNLALLPHFVILSFLTVYWNELKPVTAVISIGACGAVINARRGLKASFGGMLIGLVIGGFGSICILGETYMSGDPQQKDNYNAVRQMLSLQGKQMLTEDKDYREEVDDYD